LIDTSKAVDIGGRCQLGLFLLVDVLDKFDLVIDLTVGLVALSGQPLERALRLFVFVVTNEPPGTFASSIFNGQHTLGGKEGHG
jgi:hypothetical protein